MRCEKNDYKGRYSWLGMNRKTSGMALTGFAAVFALLALTPASASLLPTGSADSPVLYGMAELTYKNGDGDIVAAHTVHNDLVNYGEGVLIQGVFGTLEANKRPHVICISDAADTVIEEDTVALAFARQSSFSSGATCIVADIETNATTAADDTGSRAIMNATFSSDDGDDNIIAGQTINTLAICDSSTSATALNDCGSTGALFSAVGVDFTGTVSAADTVDVTYTFDLRSPDN
ncbi:hypothetical protein CENSYa_1543 [Cenarchaeum symbiosum A]|uniref:Uncharacterized protein n=1 Tax=Cenarchaeum symbiosum (strain A) TaxID=414004 RepID=A0RXU8_CENSY|nr:hypothetical protein CENSYa_1543 [Cenarchaeum symbiosum A]